MILFVCLQLLLSLIALYILFKNIIFSPVSRSASPRGFSLIIPFKNEAENIYSLLKSLAAQNCDADYEVILINDDSTDDFLQPLRQAKRDFPGCALEVLTLTERDDTLSSKQNAIEYGVSKARFDWLVMTDADMCFTPSWLQNYYDSCDCENAPFVYGRTAIFQPRSFLEKIQSVQLDFLFVSSWLLTRAGLDSSCMGNNLCISKALYTKIGGQRSIGYTMVEDKKLFGLVRKAGVNPQPVEPFAARAFTYGIKSASGFYAQMLRWIKGGFAESVFLRSLFFLLFVHFCMTPAVLSGAVFQEALYSSVATWGVLAGVYFYGIWMVRPGIHPGNFFLYILCFPCILAVLAFTAPFKKVSWKGSVFK
jgi:cellulose synthase/poly-beta-1,6-N-acetylglucosamine synthase-like glycosyltransferase